MKTLVLIPTYNERDNLRLLVDKILSLSNDIYILIIDDNSPDGTGKVADELTRQFKRIFVLHREKKERLARAYVDGFKYALNTDADYIVQMDSDLSHNPIYILEFLRKIQDYDVVIGSRFIDSQAGIINWPLYRLILTRGANLYLRICSGLNLTDYTSGFKWF
jgi:dolichol-phosphate mannosyltransferase